MFFNPIKPLLKSSRCWGLSAVIAFASLPLYASPGNGAASGSSAPTPLISEQQAISAVFNRIEQRESTIVVRNRHHLAEFNQQGVYFTPTRGPSWHWQIKRNATLSTQAASVTPTLLNNAIDYVHQDYIERYLLKSRSIEQRFIINQPYQAAHDLVIEGKINSPGQFEATDNGWVWHDAQGQVSLGQVTVFDATGKILPASMHSGANYSRIIVAASVLKTASYPVTIDPEIGGNDLRLSDMGHDGDADFDAFYPAVSYNTTNNEYLVVWRGDDDRDGLVNDELEIFGQRVNAVSGAEIGGDLRFSDMGPDGDVDFDASLPAVSYNASNNEYLVVWQGDDDSGGLVDDEFEIFGQRVDAASGAEIGGDLRFSDMGPDGDTDFDAFSPAISYNASNNEYLVVWRGDDDSDGLVDNEFEIFGQRINAANGAEIGGDFRLSDMGPDGSVVFGVFRPDVSYNINNNEYLVVWDGEDDTGALVDNEFEIFGQRINAASGAEIGSDLRFSNMGPDGETSFSAFNPAVSYNARNNEYLVVWQGDDDSGALVSGEFEIFGQRVDAASGAEISGDLRFSDMGPDGDIYFFASRPAVGYNASNNEYLVVWDGDDDSGTLVDNEFEIFGQRINAANGAEIGGDLRFSDMGPDGDIVFGAFRPAVSYNASNNEYLVVWDGEDDSSALADGELEIYGQRFAGPATLRFVSATPSVAEAAGSVQIEVERVGDTSNMVTVDFTTVDGTATAPTDYTTANGTLTFNPGESNQVFTIAISDNSDIDGDKTVNLGLSNVQATSGEVVLDTQLAAALLTIIDDDTVPAHP